MCPARLNTNLRYRAVLHRRAVVAVAAATAALLIVASLVMWRAGGQAGNRADSLRQHNEQMIESIARLEQKRETLGIDDERARWLFDTLDGLRLPAARTPAAILYELERIVPEAIYLTDYSQDFEGQVEILVSAANRRELAGLTEKLHASSELGDVQVVNLKENRPGRFEVRIRLKGRMH